MAAVRGDGETIGHAERVSRLILHFVSLFSPALMPQGIYFLKKRKAENLGRPTFPKIIFFLTLFPGIVQSKRSAETVDANTAQMPLVVPTSRLVYSLGFEFCILYKYKRTRNKKPDHLPARKLVTSSPKQERGAILYEQATSETDGIRCKPRQIGFSLQDMHCPSGNPFPSPSQLQHARNSSRRIVQTSDLGV